MDLWLPVKFTFRVSWKANKKLLVFIVIVQTVIALTAIIDLYSYKLVIDSLSGSTTPFRLSPYGVIILLLIYYLIYKIVEGVANYSWHLLEASQSVTLNRQFIEKLSTLDLAIYEEPQNVGLANRAFNRFQMQFKYYLKAIIDVYTSSIKVLMSLVIFFWVSPILAGCILVANGIHIYIRSRQAYGQFTIYRADDEIKRKFEYIVTTLFSKETLPEIKLYQSFNFFKDKITRIYQQFTSRELELEKKHLFYDTIAGFLPTISIFVYSLYIVNLVSQGKINVGSFAFLFFNSLWFNGALFNLGQNLGHLHADSLFMKDAIDFFDLKPHITFLKFNALHSQNIVDKLDKPVISIENVTFSYPSGKSPVLKNIWIKIPYGQNLAIVGENGAGKTTLVKLLLRMYDPTSGRITINGIDIRDIPEKILYGLYSTLFQSFGKFYFTIRENIKIAAGDQQLSDVDITSYLKFSNAWEFVKNFKQTVNQQLGSEFSQGTDLSGGQWQRLAIARAYAKKAPFLILDEPTSAVDPRSEMEIFDRLTKRMRHNTLIFISHRFSTIKDADRIIVLDQGKIVEDGTHGMLMKNQRKYSSLYTIQASRFFRKRIQSVTNRQNV